MLWLGLNQNSTGRKVKLDSAPKAILLTYKNAGEDLERSGCTASMTSNVSKRKRDHPAYPGKQKNG
jgi:hypothetical protein